MKTLIISCGFHPVTNGMGGAIENLVETYLIENDKKFKNDITLYSVKTYFGKESKERKFDHTEVRIIDKTNIFYKMKQIVNLILFKITKKYTGNVYIREVIKDLEKRNEILSTYDCIIIQNIGKFVPILRKLTKSKLILHLHNDYLNKNTDNAKQIIQSCDNIWCVSEFICNRVREVVEDDIEKQKVKLLYNGINLKEFKKEITDREKQELRKKYGFSEKEKIILYVGRLMPEKGIKELLLAFKKLSEKRKDISLLIVGGTIEIKKNKDKFVTELEKIAKTINNKVVFTGNIEHKNLYEVYSIADIQVVPSKWEEAFGLIVIEGMTYSVPLIVTNSGGIPEIVQHNYEFLVDKNSNLIDGLYEKLEDFFEHPEKVKEMIKKYPEKVARFTEEKYSENLNILMNKVKEME